MCPIGSVAKRSGGSRSDWRVIVANNALDDSPQRSRVILLILAPKRIDRAEFGPIADAGGTHTIC
jgi:hypothetical protein